MFKKLINAFTLTLALGAFCCTRPAFATKVKDSSHCLNGPNQGAACAGVTQMGCEITESGSPDGPYYTRRGYHRSGGVQYLYSCSLTQDVGQNCCSKEIFCYRLGYYAYAVHRLGDISDEALCALAEQATNAPNQTSQNIMGETCFDSGSVNGKSCG